MTCGFRNCQSRACGSTVRPDGHELAFCVAHEAIARHLPPLRSAACCTSEGCGRPQGSRSPLCKSCRPRYAAWGLDGYPAPQEAPMTEPTPEAQTPPPAEPQEAAGGGATPSAHPLEARRDRLVATLLGAGFEEKPAISGRVRRFAYCNDYWVIVPNGPAAESQEDFARALDTAEAALKRLTSTVDAPHLPVAFAPVDAVDSFAADDKPSVVAHIAAITEIERDLRARRDAVAARLISAGFEMEYGTLQTTAYRKGDLLVSLPMDDRGLSLSEFERMVVRAEVVAPTAIISALLKDAAEMATAEPPSPEVVADFLLAPKPAPADDGEPSEGDVADAPLFVGGTTVAPMQPMSPDLAALTTDPMQQRREAVVARLLALGFKEREGTDTLRMFLGHGWSVPIPLPGHDASPRKAEDMLDDAERLCRRMEKKAEPTAPGPTLAEVQAQLERERERADRAELDAVQERERADEAKAELAAIAALLDPEDAPAYDSDDQPIPLPVRVQTALMPDPIGKSELERRITKALDRYDAPKGFGSLGQASPYGRVLLTARENKQLKADKAALQGIINDTEWIVHHCGSYGATASLADRVLRLLPAERQRAVLELKRAEAYIDVARLQARFLNPPPPGRLDECTAKMAEIEAKIAALPSLPPSTTPLADDLRDLVGRIRCECHGEEAAAVCAELLTVAETLARMEVQ